jgi:ferrous iron transport protein A
VKRIVIPNPLSLADVPIKGSARVVNILTIGANRRRLLDLGLVPGSRVEVIRRSPTGNPTAYLIKGTLIALRNEDARQILVDTD